MLIARVTVPVYGEASDAGEYAVVSGIRLQQLTSSILLSDGTFLLTGMADNAGICMLLDQHGNLIRQYRIDTPNSNHGATDRGATRIGENIIADENDCLWIVGTIENGEYCYIAKLNGQ